MFAVEVYAAVRHFVFVEGHSRREAARVFGLSRETVLKMCRFSLPPGYTRTKPVEKGPRPLALPVAADLRHRDLEIIVQDRQRHAAEEGERRHMSVEERLGRLARISMGARRRRVRRNPR